MSNTRVEQLIQIFNGATWDGDLISKQDRDALVKAGLVSRADYGYNIITSKGVDYIVELNLVSPGYRPDLSQPMPRVREIPTGDGEPMMQAK